MLILSRKIDQKIRIGDEITLTIIEVHGDQVKIGVEAFEEIQSENKAAATQPSLEQMEKLFSKKQK